MKPVPITSGEGKEFLDSFKPSTRKVYASGLGIFLHFYRETGKGKKVEDFLNAVEEDMQRPRRERKRVARNVLKEFISWLKDRKYTPKTIRTYISTIQSLANYYDISISTRHVNLPSSQPVSKKYPWTLEELGEFISGITDLELKSIAATAFQSGLGLAEVLNITWGDIKREYQEGVVPLCFDFSREKTDVPFMTFIGSFGFSYLKEYLAGRERMKDADPIYNMSEVVVELRFRGLAKKKLGSWEGYNPMRPHSLRSAFRTFLGDERVSPEFIEFWMGHRAPEQKRVYVSKSREGWRKTYAQHEHCLTPKSVSVPVERDA
ncbi:hypothetical protein ES703_46323 [subsurface metagenome]